MKPQLYIQFSLRSEGGARDGGGLTLPLRGAWQEDANDLHVAFAYKGAAPEDGCWYRPAEDKKTGDYLLPAPDWAEKYQIVRRKSPQTGEMTKCVLAYCIDWLGTVKASSCEDTDYIKRIEEFWYSPNL
jgi:hypothetical protein